MNADRGRWRKRGWVAVLISFSGFLVCLNLVGGRSPVKMGVLTAFRPLFAILGEIDPPAPEGEEERDPELESLRARNARLTYEVLRLRDQLATISNASFDEKRYLFLGLPAQVLCRAGVPGLRDVVVVDRGSKDGVRVGMGVASRDCVVGRVYRVGEEICLVLRVTDPACKVRATFLPKDRGESPDTEASPEFEGLCEGDLDREGELTFRHLPVHAGVEKGLPVVTTGYSGIFPAGMSVGTVKSVSGGTGGLFLNVAVRPAPGGKAVRSVVILLPSLLEDLGADVVPGGRGR